MKARSLPVPIPLLLAVGIAAISFSAIFIRLSDAPVSVMGMYRLVLTNVLLLPFMLGSGPAVKRATARDWLLTGLSGLFLGAHYLLWMGSLRLTSVASSTVILALQPIFVLVGAYWLFRERTTGKAIAGMSVAIAGSLLIGWGDIRVAGDALTGDLLSLAGTFAIAIHMLIGQLVLRRMPAILYSFSTFASAALVFVVYNGAMGFSFGGYEGRDWLIFALLAFVPTVFGQMLFNWLLRYVSATNVSMSVLGEPVGAALLALWLLDERITGLQMAAGAVILLGVWYFLKHNKTTVNAKLEQPDAPRGQSA
ncbi:DMT family transporter [Paenibacillus sp. MBLB4367]|uniref:DMT family transporter n=1 Tax=Paenibacillus sp. MBLB4367 TaxID=3384767 RepID=UPI0039080ECE